MRRGCFGVRGGNPGDLRMTFYETLLLIVVFRTGENLLQPLIFKWLKSN